MRAYRMIHDLFLLPLTQPAALLMFWEAIQPLKNRPNPVHHRHYRPFDPVHRRLRVHPLDHLRRTQSPRLDDK